MDRCTHYQSQMLDYVYDLLDAEVVQALTLHLAHCADCQAALRAARGQQQLLAAAARLEFPSVCFRLPETPVEVPETVRLEAEPAPEPVILPARPTLVPMARPRRLAWRAWLSAAAVLLALSVPAGLRWDYLGARRDLDQYDTDHAQARRNHETVTEQLLRLDRDEQQKTEGLDQQVRQEERHVTVIGPRTIQSGTPNEYQIATYDGLGAPVTSRLTARVYDKERGKLLYEETDKKSEGNYRLTLPPNLLVGPDARVMLEVIAADGRGSESRLREAFRLTAPLYLTHLATDKPVYQPGETVRFRSLTLERFSLTPAREQLALHFTLSTPGGVVEVPRAELRGSPDALAMKAAVPFYFGWSMFGTPLTLPSPPGGEGATDKPSPPQGEGQKRGVPNDALRGIAAGEWEVPAGYPPGEYTLTVSEEQNRFPPQRRKFLVHHFEKPRLLKELDFTRRGYGPGEEVVAICRASRVDSSPLANRPVTATVKVDGQTYGEDGRAGGALRLSTDAEGKVHVRFRLPARIEKGRASVEVTFHDGKQSESLFRPVPVVLKRLEVEFYPESGYLVPGGPNRVYFRARTPAGRAAELKGRLFDDLGDEVAHVETFHADTAAGANQGTGSFTLTPHRGRTYHLKVDNPAGVEVRNTLTTSELGKVALTILSPVTTAHEPIAVRVRSAGADRKLLVAAYCRGRLFDHKWVDAKAEQEAPVQLNPAHGIGGVYRVTVFEETETDGPQAQLEPRAERLVFRRHRDRLNLSVAADKDSYVPGQDATLTVMARGENQESIPAVALLSVVDRAALSLGDEKSARSMPAHFYLASEVQGPDELEYADFLLTTNSAAERALDLLLGTQGWRRFVERELGEFQDRPEADVLALSGTVEVPRVARKDRREEQAARDSKVALGRNQLHARFQAEREQLLGRQAELDESLRETRLAPAYLEARAKVASYESLVLAIRALFPLVGLFLVIAAAVLLGRGLVRPAGRAVPHFSAAVGCAALLLILGVVAFSGRRERDGDGVESQQASVPPKKAEDAKEKSEKGKEAIAAPRMKRDGASEGKESGGPPRASRSSGDNEGTAKDANSDEKPHDGAFVPESVPPMPGLVGPQPPAPSHPGPIPVAPPPGGGARGSMGRSGETKTPTIKPTAPAGFSGGFGGAGGFAGAMIGGPANSQASATTSAAKGDKSGVATGQGVRTYVDEAELEKAAKLKHIEERAGKDIRNATQAKGRQQGQRPSDPRLDDGAARFFTREYRHLRKELEDWSPDLTDTVCWQPALILSDGRVEVGFNLNDAVTTYQVTVFAHTLDGRLAAATRTLEARKPLTVQPLIPFEVTAGDRIDVPVQVLNRTPKEQDVDLNFFRADGKQAPPTAPKPQTTDDPGKTTTRLKLPPGKVQRFMYPLVPEVPEDEATLRVEGLTQNLGAETVRRSIRVVPQGFPITGSHSGLLEGKDEHTILLPREWVKGTLDCRIEVFPSALADLQKGLDALLRQPGGNFEQAATTSHSNVLLLDQLKESKESRPELEKRSHDLLESSYRAMTTFECVDPVRQVPRGFEWFGGTAPPHDALTAYGLMQFRDLARFQEVDRALLDRTRKFLLSSRDRSTRDSGSGGFSYEKKPASNLGGLPAPVSDAYVVWALTESGNEDNVTRELNALAQRAKVSKDPYFLALVANSLASRKRAAEAVPLLRKVVAAQKDDGHLDAEQTSVTGSRGRDLQIETTALAVLGWQRADATQFRAPVEKAVRWLDQQRDGHGAFGSTQATVLALKALAAQARGASRAVEDGEVSVSVGGQRVARLSFKAGASAPLVLALPEPEKFLKPGANSVRIELTGKNRLPSTLSWSYRSLEPAHDEACPVRLSTALDRSQATEGQRVRLTVQLENIADREQGVAVAVVGLPAGLSLAKDAERARVSSLEVRGRELMLSWRGLTPRQKIEVPIDLVCRVPGEYRGPTSRAYLQYDADHKTWAAPLQIRIIPKK